VSGIFKAVEVLEKSFFDPCYWYVAFAGLVALAFVYGLLKLIRLKRGLDEKI